MAIITAPDFRIRKIDWTFDRPSQVNSSAFTGKRTAPANPWFGRWLASVELAPIQGEASYRSLRSFFVRCCGQLNSFKLYAVTQTQNSNSGVTVGATAAAGATSMALSGAATPMKEGQLVTVNDQLLLLTANQSGNTINFEPQLRAQASLGTAVETSRPWALVRLRNPQSGWDVDPGQVFGASFDVEEAF